MKHQNITLSIPAELNALLHVKVSRRGISKYVSKAILKALQEDEKKEEQKLEAFYEAASKDVDREKEIRAFDALEELNDNPDWEWEHE